MSIQIIIFDMGNVLLEWNPEKIIKAVEPNEMRQRELKQSIFESGIWNNIDSGEYAIEVAENLVCKLLDESYHEAVHKIMWHWYCLVDIFYEVQSLAMSLVSAGYKLYILSNTSPLFYNIIESGCLPITEYISGVVHSCEEQQMKPHKSLYQTLLNRYQLLPEKCLFIDDIAENVMTAQTLGINGFIATDVSCIVEKLTELIEIRTVNKKEGPHSDGND